MRNRILNRTASAGARMRNRALGARASFSRNAPGVSRGRSSGS